MPGFAPITLGHALRVAESDSFLFTETRHGLGAFLPAHAHEKAAISYVISGPRTYAFGSTRFHCEPRSAMFVPAGAEHESKFSAVPGRGLMIELKTGGSSPAGFDTPIHSADPGLVRLCDLAARELRDADDLTPLALESVTLELLVRKRRSEREPAPPWLHRVREILHENFTRVPSLATIAAETGVDRSMLTREFRRRFRASIGEYVRRLRLERAWQLVEGTRNPLSDVAVKCGFADQSHLTRAFRRAYGVTPGTARARRFHSAPSVQDGIAPEA